MPRGNFFRKFWDKSLQSAVIEAIGEKKKENQNKILRNREVQALLIQAEAAPSTEERIFENLWSVTAESEKSLVFATIEKSDGDAWMRRNFLWK